MRTLTMSEITAVSGGEAPCITLQTQCIEPRSSAQMSNFFNGVSVFLIAFGRGVVATRLAAASAVAGWLFDQG